MTGQRPRGRRIDPEICSNPELCESYQRLHDLLIAFPVVVDHKFHELKNQDVLSAIRFVQELEQHLRTTYLALVIDCSPLCEDEGVCVPCP
jgi:hypothetical protein